MMARLMPPVFLLITASVAVAQVVGPVKIQRRNPVESAAGVVNDVGELTYSVDEHGRATLTVGAHEGNAVVSDPYCIRLAPQRVLQPTEWAPTLSEGATVSDGRYVLFDKWKEDGTVRTVTFETGNPLHEISRVTFDAYVNLVKLEKKASGNKYTITATADYDSFWDPAENGARCYISNVVVHVWTGSQRVSEVDFTVSDIKVTDGAGTVNWSDLRPGIHRRYDGRTGVEWSKFPAIASVRLDGHPVLYDWFGSVRTGMVPGTTNRWHMAVNGVPVVEVSPGVTEVSEQLRILSLRFLADDRIELAISSALESPVTVQTVDTLEGNPAWMDIQSGLTSSYPEKTTVTVDGSPVPAYILTLGVDPAAPSGFYRAKSMLPGLGTTSIHIKNCDFYVDGVKLGIVTQTVNSVQYEFLGRAIQ